jgi:lysophospholipase L1-like esterase
VKNKFKYLTAFTHFNYKGLKIIEVFLFVILSISIFNPWSLERVYFTQHLELILYLFITFKLFFDFLKVSKKYQKKINYLIYLILIIEILLRVTVKGNRINDLENHQYNNQYSCNNINIYRTYPPFLKIKKIYSEFQFDREYNSLGFSDIEWDTAKNNNIRILCLGDSFTEGYGVSSDSSYVSILEKNLKIKFKNIEVMNAGNCGSDPFFNFKNYEDKLIYFNPDIIIQEYWYYDLYTDIPIRNGNERFKDDSTVQFRSPPKWEKIYARSYIFRILTHTLGGYNLLLVKDDEMPKIIKDNTLKANELFEKYKKLSTKNKTDLIVYTFPVESHLNNNLNNDFHTEMEGSFSKFGLKFYNLQPCYEDEIKRTHSKPQDYYWKIDGHHNAKGYEMMAKCLEEIVTPVIEKRIENQNTLVN